MSISQKQNLGNNLNLFADAKINDAIQQLGQSLPCKVIAISGSIVVVDFNVSTGFNFPLVKMPVLGCEYFRQPLQVGCKGVCISVDARIGVITGIGPIAADDISVPGNLSSLVFVPVGNTGWFAAPGDQSVIYGQNGVILGTANSDGFTNYKIDINNNGISVTMPENGAMTVGNVTIKNNQITLGNVTITETDVTVGGISLLSHVHGGVTTGSGSTGVPS